MTLSPLYLRDLNQESRLSMEAFIRNERPDLILSLDNGDDITIGGYYKSEQFEKN